MVTRYEITLDGTQYVVEIGDVSTSPVQVIVNGKPKTVSFSEVAEAARVTKPAPPPPVREPAPVPVPEPAPAAAPAPEVMAIGAGAGHVVGAPMPGKILSVAVSVGDQVSEGDTVCTLEAMKMEMPISATGSGAVSVVHVKVGDNVAYDDPLVTLA